jgi:hypothetical protein
MDDDLEVAAAILARRTVRGVRAEVLADEIECVAHPHARSAPAL